MTTYFLSGLATDLSVSRCRLINGFTARSAKNALTALILCGLLLSLASSAQAASRTWLSGTNGGLFTTNASWINIAAPQAGDDVIMGDVNSTIGVVRTGTDTGAVSLNSITITQATSATTGTNNNYLLLTGNQTLTGATPLTITGAGAAGLATLDLGGRTLTLSNGAGKTITLGNYTVLANSSASAATFSSTGGNLTLNFNGGQIAGSPIATGTGVTVNVAQSIGASGTLQIGANGGTAINALNLSATGDLALGGTIVNYANSSTVSSSNGLVVTIANTMTSLSSGVITTQVLMNSASPLDSISTFTAVYANNVFANSGTTSLTFASGGTGFTVNGGIIDVRSASVTSGTIATNGNNITINSGGLAANRLVATSGVITLNGGQLALRDTSGGVAGAVNYSIANTGSIGSNIIVMPSTGGTGTLSLSNSKTASTITLPSLFVADGTWNRGTINADTNYTIANTSTTGFGTSGTLSRFTIAANCGLNGLAMGTAGIPTTLTLGVNSSFFVASSTAPGARTYNVGSDASNNVITPVAGSGGFTFGINNSTAAQTINLNRDKSGDGITLISNGTGGAINIATSQTGTGNLNISTKTLTLNAGVNFGGTGGIVTDAYVGDYGGESVLSNAAGQVNGAGQTSMVFNVNGALTGTNNIVLNPDGATTAGMILIGATGSVGGIQTWSLNGNTNTQAFGNNLTTPSNWTGITTMTVNRGGLLEASTNTSAPSVSSNYKFASVSLLPGGGQTTGYFKLTNSTQNDGSAVGQNEALYTGTLTTGFSDSSSGRAIFDLNGQDLYLDRFNNFNNLTTSSPTGLLIQNSAANSVSQLKAIGTVGDTAATVGFQVLNSATLQVVGGNFNTIVDSRMNGTYSADTAAAPNCGNGTADNTQTTLAFNNAASGIGAFQSFLGSGVDTGANTCTTNAGTNGTLRVLGGHIVLGGYVLNPVGTVGVIDTTGVSSGENDVTLDTVTVRGGGTQSVTASLNGGVATFTPSLKQVYSNGDPVVITATTIFGGMTSGVTYYVVNATDTTFQLSTTPTGPSISGLSGSFSGGTAKDVVTNGITAYPALVVAGTTTVNGNLVIGVSPGSVNQASLRVGGDNSTGYITATGPTAHAGNGLLIVTGNLTTQTLSGTSVNISIQSNGAVKVGGNVTILGTGTNTLYSINDVAGKDGVGINAASNFTLNGNTSVSAPQTINIVPAVGRFHVGDGSVGILTGVAANAQLTANLAAAGNADINGASSLDLNGQTLTLNNASSLTVGGGATLFGHNGTINGSATNLVTVAGGASSSTRGTISQVDGDIGRLTLGGGLTLGSGGGVSLLNFEIGNGLNNTGADQIAVNGALTLSGSAYITLANLGEIANNRYSLMTFNGNATGSGTITFADGTQTQSAQGKKYILTTTTGAEVVDVSDSLIYNLAVVPSAARVMKNQSTSIAVKITNAGATGDLLTFSNLTATATDGTVTGSSSDNGTNVAVNETRTSTGVTFKSSNTGTVDLAPTALTWNAGYNTTATLGTSSDAQITVVDNRIVQASAVDLGNVFAHHAVSGTSLLNTSGDSNHWTTISVDSQTFNSANSTGTHIVSKNFDKSGAQSGSDAATVASIEHLDGEALAGVNAGYTANVFQEALLSTSANESDLRLTNAASNDNGNSGQRAGVTVTGLSSSNTNFTTNVGGAPSVGIATTTDVSASVGRYGMADNRLNGTYHGTVTATVQYSDTSLRKQADVNDVSWGLSNTVSGQTSSNSGERKYAAIVSGSSYAGYGLISGIAVEAGGHGTEATLIGGNASTDTTVSMAYVTLTEFLSDTTKNDSKQRISDIVSIQGMPSKGTSEVGSSLTDQFVLQISYSGSQPGYVGWYDTNMSKFVNAIAGNSTLAGGQGITEFNPDDGYFQGNTAYDSATMDHLGYYGYDSAHGVAWAVVDHKSEFAVTAEAVPEPATWVMLFGGLGVLVFCQRLRRNYFVSNINRRWGSARGVLD